MIKAVEVKALEKYKIWVKFNDGVEGIVDLSDCAGKGVFEIWNEPGVFENVKARGSGIEWTDKLDIDATKVYMDITGKSYDEIIN